MIIRVSIANLDLAEAAKFGQDSGFSGTVYPNIGFGSWGVEHGVTFEFAGQSRETIRAWTRKLLVARGETAAYVTIDGNPFLWYGKDDVQESL